MADAATLKEFLIALGFKVDPASERKFTTAIAEASKQAAALGAAVVATTTAVVASVARISTEFEALYYSSQRVKASAANIQSFAFGVSQMGSTAEAARTSLENLGRILRTMPGSAGILQSLGINPKQDATKIMDDLGRAFRQMPYFRANAYAQVLGIDERTLDALIADTGKFATEYRDMLRRAGMDSEAAARSGKTFMQELRTTVAALEILGQKIGHTLSDRLSGGIRSFRQLVVSNYDQITRVIGSILNGFLTAADVAMRVFMRIADLVSTLIQKFGEMDPKLRGAIEALAGLALGWKLLNAAFLASPIGRIMALAAALVLLWDDYKTWKEGGESAIDWEKWEPQLRGAVDLIGKLATAFKDLTGITVGWETAMIALAAYLSRGWIRAVAKPILSVLSMLALIPGSGVSASAVAGLAAAAGLTFAAGASMTGEMAQVAGARQDNNADAGGAAMGAFRALGGAIARGWRALRGGGGPDVQGERPAGGPPVVPPTGQSGARFQQGMEYFMKQGWTREQAAGIMSNLHAESGYRTDIVGDGGKAHGIAQWHPPRQANFERLFNKKVLQASYEEQLAFVDWELRNTERRAGDLLRQQQSASGAGRVVSQHYERPADVAGEAARRGLRAEQLNLSLGAGFGTQLGIDRARAAGGNVGSGPVNNSNTINVNGSVDGATAQHILTELDRSNQDLVRNMRGSVQ